MAHDEGETALVAARVSVVADEIGRLRSSLTELWTTWLKMTTVGAAAVAAVVAYSVKEPAASWMVFALPIVLTFAMVTAQHLMSEYDCRYAYCGAQECLLARLLGVDDVVFWCRDREGWESSIFTRGGAPHVLRRGGATTTIRWASPAALFVSALIGNVVAGHRSSDLFRVNLVIHVLAVGCVFLQARTVLATAREYRKHTDRLHERAVPNGARCGCPDIPSVGGVK